MPFAPTLAASLLAALTAAPPAGGATRPLLRDFMGLCTHTVQFRPKLYQPVCRLARDYHPFGWDVGDDTSFWPLFPAARNKVDWAKVYGAWRKAGFDVNASITFGKLKAKQWKDLARDAETYGWAFARCFGPSGRGLVASAEIGNEPGHYDDATYRRLFEHMARGMRAADPRLTIATCAATPGASGKYAKSLACVQGLESLYDVITLHTYAFLEHWPTWRRTYPEDPRTEYLNGVRETIRWRDAHAPGKPIWVTEFGWDACTKPAPRQGTFAKWVGSTDTEQAQWLVRSFLLFSALAVERAYVFWFNDSDKPQVHGSSGLTRDYRPKPAYHAVAHLHRTLGAYRFARAVSDGRDGLYVYEYEHGKDGAACIWAAWSPADAARRRTLTPPAGWRAANVERMPTQAGPAKPTAPTADDAVEVQVGPSPVYIRLKRR